MPMNLIKSKQARNGFLTLTNSKDMEVSKAELRSPIFGEKQLTLGELVELLGYMAERSEWRKADDLEEAVVIYDFGYIFPTKIDSWRGSYDEVAINYQTSHAAKPMTITKFYNMIKGQIGTKMHGWKGGEYTISEMCPVWVANRGETGETAVVGVEDKGYNIVLLTSHCEF